jgi:3-dehydroquinate dehydratase-2
MLLAVCHEVPAMMCCGRDKRSFLGDAINRIYEAVDSGIEGIIMNPAGITYAVYALKDCLKGVGLPYMEVHISHIAPRNIHCVLSDVSDGIL